jgi:hypothetical protein
MADKRLYYTATDRNRDPILDILRRILPPEGLVLEIASGSGEHSVHFARALPALRFLPTDPDPTAVESIAAWAAHEAVENILPPLLLDASAEVWPVTRADAILCINMIHISPWAATEGLLRHAGQILPAGAALYLYGPYRRKGVATAPSNESFDLSLKSRNPAWGLRNVEDVAALARQNSFGEPEIVEMPANNLSVIFRRT